MQTTFKTIEIMYFYPEGPSSKKKRFDNFLSGFLPALLVPFIIVILISAKTRLFETDPISLFIAAYRNIFFAGWMLAALIPNLVYFFFLYKTMRERAAYGLVSATLFYVALIVLKSF